LDRTEQFVQVLNRELAATQAMKEEFVSDFSLEDFDALVSGWEGKLQRCAAGDQKWGLFVAMKQ
jgi:phosphoethanolamine N-methyltransferase